MERQLLGALYRWINSLALKSPAGVQIPDVLIVLVYLWSVLCDRPVSWATREENWPREFAWLMLPSDSTMSRRLRTASVEALQTLLLARLNQLGQPVEEHWVDGKPLPVGGATQDPDARAGRGAGMLAKGYKLHAIWACNGLLDAWCVTPLNVAEPKMALAMVPALRGPGHLVGDHLFDWRKLYAAAGAVGLQLVVTPEKNGTPAPGQRKQDPYRLIGLKLAHTPQGQAMLKRRFGIDRLFGQLGNQPGGLGPLPNWVRRLPRVRRWVQGKLIWFAFRRQPENKDL